ncbi:heterokaryon incompatibility protein-domain-containing protein [Cercophora newfieldiana]|uniref:Heterokaryon incompatibility protein-domain-containing protein n=1 Tax=Cercophora newfieldiana TaxID=92897 RepID=A0AA40CWD9_9PEZI|nr:heterokaryon incompatibility protein-domain-containing protein [Cercophora newfieldiana]
MKLSIIAAALIAGAAAAPNNLLAKRAMCLVYTVEDATTSTSPLVTDCEALAETNLSEDWIPSEPDNYTFSVEHGTCGLRGVFNPTGSNVPASQNIIRPDMVSGAIENAIARFAVDGRIGATGYFMCLDAGMVSKTGWTSFEIYTVESVGTASKLPTMDLSVTTNLSKELRSLELSPVSPYEGQDIDLKQDHIRLLTLLPGSPGDPIVCTSTISSLSDKPVYTALSYVWGQATECVAIQFNTALSFPITRNLHTALTYLRDATSKKIFWIDALCINQDHPSEKPHQIQLMGDIYKSATETCIWLGPESDTSDLAISIIRSLDGDNLTSPSNSPSPKGLQAIAELQRRPWWSRVWVIQEALLSPNPVVHCGHATLSMEAFMVLDDIRRGWHRPSKQYMFSKTNSITNLSLALRNPFSGIVTFWPDARTRFLNPTPESSPSTLAEWAHYLSDFHATDPKDKIYGLLGLGSDSDRKLMRYALENNMTTGQVYTRAMMWFLMTSKHLLHLSFDKDSTADCPVGETGQTLPSWVVDFSENVPADHDAEKEGEWFRPGYVTLLPKKGYNATGDGRLLGERIEGDMFPFEKLMALKVRGLVVDRVVYVSGNRHMRLDENIDAEARMRYSLERMRRTAAKVVEWEAEFMKPGCGDPYGGDGGLDGRPRREVFRRAIVGDRDDSGLEFEWTEEWDDMLEILLGRKEMPLDELNQQPTDEARLQHLLPIRLALLPKTSGRSFVITSKGYIGLAPLKSKVGDEVCVLEGGTVPFVLRPVEDSVLAPFGVISKEGQRFFELVGESYVHGVSNGDWIKDQNEGDVIDVVIV